MKNRLLALALYVLGLARDVAHNPFYYVRYAVSTSRKPVQVFVVDAIVAFAASYLALTALSMLKFGLPIWQHHNQGPLAGFAAFMAGVGGALGAVGAQERKDRAERSAVRTIAWSILLPVIVVAALASQLGVPFGDWSVMLMIAFFAPAATVAGYRMLGFRPKKANIVATWFTQRYRSNSALDQR